MKLAVVRSIRKYVLIAYSVFEIWAGSYNSNRAKFPAVVHKLYCSELYKI